MNKKMGVFLTFEGVEGCGKTTQLELLYSKMKSAGIPVLATREPGGTDLGKGLRDILLFSEKDSIDIGTELLLYEADRIQHVKEVIIPSENKKDLAEIDEKEILESIEIHFVENASEIIKKAFMSKIIPYKDDGKKDLKIPEKTIARDKSPLPH